MSDEFKATAVIVYPALWPTGADESHCTIGVLGETATLDYSVQDVLRVLHYFEWPDLTVAATGGIDWFGPDKNIPVVRLLGEHLHVNYQYLDLALASEGIAVDKTHGEYKPHVTINPFDVLDGDALAVALGAGQSYAQHLEQNIIIPDSIGLTKPQVWWGNEHYS